MDKKFYLHHMQKMKLPQKIIIVNIAIAFAIAILFAIAFGGSNGGEFALSLGLVSLGLGLLNLFIGMIMLLSNNVEWRNGLLISGAILLLLSGISCGGGAAFA